MWKLVVSKTKNYHLTHNTTEKLKFKLSGQKMKKKLSIFAYTKQQVDQIKRKIVANFNKPLFIQKTNIFKRKSCIVFPKRSKIH